MSYCHGRDWSRAKPLRRNRDHLLHHQRLLRKSRRTGMKRRSLAWMAKARQRQSRRRNSSPSPSHSPFHLRFLTFFISWAAAKAAKLAGPVAHGSKEVPDGVPDALAGLSFVFTGELSSFSREEAVDLAKRFGGFVIFLFPSSTCLTKVTPFTVAWLASHQVRPTLSSLVTVLVQASWLRSRSTAYEL